MSKTIAHYPLSSPQKGILFDQMRHADTPLYNIGGYVRIDGPVNHNLIEKSVNQVVQENDALRTILHENTPLPTLDFSEDVNVKVDFHDFSSENDPHQHAIKWMEAELGTPFQLYGTRLSQFALIKVSDACYYGFCKHHHLIIDGWGISLFFQHVAKQYDALVAGEASDKQPRYSYLDFIQDDQKYLESDAYKRHERYWQEKFRDLPEPLMISPKAGKVNGKKGKKVNGKVFPSHRKTLTLKWNLYHRLIIFSKNNQVTTFHLILAVLYTYFIRTSDGEDFIIGLPVLNRKSAAFKRTMGLFTGVTPARFHFGTALNFIELMQSINAELRKDYRHQRFPLGDINQLAELHKIGRQLFDITLSYQKHDYLTAFGGNPAKVVTVPNGFEQSALAVAIEEYQENQEVRVTFDYNVEAFDDAEIERIVARFESLLGEVLERPTVPIRELHLMPAEERRKVLFEFNDTAVYYPFDKTIVDLFEEQVEKTPHNVAVVFEDQQFTYQALNTRANQLAHYLQTLGVQPEVLVGICVERSLEMIVGLLAILKAGGAYVPLDPTYPQERLAFMLEDAQVPVLLTEQKLMAQLPLPSPKAQFICLDSDRETLSKASADNLVSGVKPENLAYVIYTSGSTGKPKGVQIQHQSLTNFLCAMAKEPGLTQQDVLLAVTTISFDIAALELYLPLIKGAKIMLVSRAMATDGIQLLEQLKHSGITIMQATPATWRLLLASGWQGNSHLKILIGGEALPKEIANQLINKSASVWNVYGPTETTIWSSVFQISQHAFPTASEAIGRPIANTQLYILDKHLQAVPIGTTGELHIGGDGLARGYLNRPELTAEKFILDPFSDTSTFLYKTGDLARYLPDGNIEYLGRIDNQVKLRGFRIELGEIEAVLALHPAVQENVIIVHEESSNDKRLVAYLVQNPEQVIDNTALRNFLKEKLPDYMIPSAFVPLEAMPLTPNGKVDRRALESSLINYQLSEDTFVAPRTPEEELLTGIWAEVLGLERVGIDDNFFEIGGHSLLATQVLSRIRDTFSCEVPLRHLFESPTVSDLAAQIETSRLSHPAATPIQAQVIKCSENLPLSFAQQRLWLLNQLEEGHSATYNIPAAIRLKGPLHVTALEQSLTDIVQRHETLRTTFVMTDGTLTQTIHPLSDINDQLSVLDLQHLPTEEQATKVKELASEEAQRPFDLAKGPLLRTTLLQLGSQEHVLLVTMHHIISDGWSIGVFIRELASLYETFSKGESSPLTPLPIQYTDFAYWQRQWLTGEVLETQINYWQQQLSGSPALLELPTDHPRPSIQTFRGAVQRFEINKALTNQLKKISHQNGATLFMTLLSAFIILLHRYSGQEDIVVGSPIANRNRSEIESLIGFFVNTLVLRTNLSGISSFEHLLKQVRKVSLEAYAHQDIPFEKLLEVLQTERNLSHSPFFQVMFVLQNAPMEKLALSNLNLTVLEMESVTAKFDLVLFMEETAQGLKSGFEYNADLFNADTISRMAEHFQTLLTGIVADPVQSIVELPLLTKAERHKLLVEWNNTAAVYPKDKSIHQLFEEQVEKTPDAVAVVFEDQQLSYQELNVRANQLAHYLQSLGIKAEVLVGICVERSFEMIIGLLGILKAGGAYVPLDPTYPQERITFMLEDTQVSVLLALKKLVKTLPKTGIKIVYLDADEQKIIAHENEENLAHELTTGNLAYVMYTSGSTGKPKGVSVIHQGVIRLVIAPNYIDLTANDVFLQLAPLSFDASTLEIWGALLHGAQLVLMPAHSPSLEELGQAIQRYQVTTLWLTAGLFHLMVEERLEDLKPVRQLLAGGEALSVPHVQKVLRVLKTTLLVNGYGPTENTTFTCCFPMTASTSIEHSVPIGRPITNTQVYILDRYQKPTPIGVSGELYTGGAGIARGYLNRPDLTAEKFIPNPFSDEPDSRLYKTGDLARYLPDGNIEFLGRIDNQVKLRGFRIELGEIEALLSQHPKVRETVVIVREDQPGNQQLVAYFVSDDTPGRIPYQSECLVEHDGKVLTLYTEDIFESGLCLQQDDPETLKEGNEINLHLLLPNEPDAHWFKGKVIWSRDTWVGVKFTQSEQALIDRSIAFLLESTGLLTAIQRLLVGNLRHYLENKVPSYMVPTHFVLLNRLPLTPNGKINRRALPIPSAEYASSIKTELLPQTEMENVIAAIWKEVLQIEKVGIYDQFFELGGHSLLIAQLQSKLQDKLGEEIPMAKLFEYPTIHAFAEYLSEERIPLPEPQTQQQNPRTRQTTNEIAIIGMAGRFPGAKNIDAFWQNLQDGVESITFFSDEELMSSGIDSTMLSQPNYVKASGIIPDVELFDAEFFRFSPKEAEMMDPQHRLFLECAWTALENAGIKAGTEEYSVGVYAGVGMNTYLLDNLYPNRQSLDSIGNYQLMIGNSTDFLPTRVSYKLNLKGPSVNVQTACSTSLVATHSACKSLLDGGCDVALAGGVSIRVPQKTGYLYQEDMIMSPDGHCRAFDARAKGIVGGNGVGVVVLKRLEDAIADGDTIHAIIKGSAINNDGSMKVGYTAPSVEGQAAVISDAINNAGIEPDTIRLIENHGTGTKLGDPIEIAALNKVFRKHTRKKEFCALGSVKTNIGHTDAAAGVAGLIKTVLALKHQLLPPSLHFERPNPHIDFANSPFYVNTKLSEWKAIDGTPRRAGVSSFGIGGTNAHVILEEAPTDEPSGESRPWQLLRLSARTESALDTATANLSTYLEQHPESNIADVAYTLIKGRQTFNHRRILVCQAHDEAILALRTVDPKSVLTHFQESADRPVVFMFSGQGTQYVNMGLELYQTEATFREQIDLCAEYLKPHLGFDLRQVLYPSEAQISEAEQQLKQTAIIQPALFVIEYALAKLWMAWGVQPEAMIGHSIGEYVAACLSGIFTLEEALSLIVARGDLMQQLPSGAMLSVSLSEQEVQPLLGEELSLAANNTPLNCVVSGTSEAVETLQKKLTEQGVACSRLRTFRAFHSKMMAPILDSFTNFVKQVRMCPPKIPYLSNVTGSWMTAEEALNHRYWTSHLRQTVRFADGIQELLKKPERIFLEVGPGRTLSTLVKRHPDKVAEQVVLSSLRHPEEEQLSDGMFLLNTLGKLWLAGGQVDWSGFYAHENRHRLPLPTYPFEHQRYWIDAPKTDSLTPQVYEVSQASLDKKRDDIADWFYQPLWKQSVQPTPVGQEKLLSWLIFEDVCGLGSQLVKKLEQADQDIITVKVGPAFTKLSDHHYTLNPQESEDYDALVKEIRTRTPQNIVHLWTVTPNDHQESTIEEFDKAQALGFDSLLFLAQSLGKQNVTDEISIAVVSNNMQAVTGEEALHPEKSTVLGPVKVIGQEYPNLNCRSIDIMIPPSESGHQLKLIEQLQAELISKTSDRVIAYRGEDRWVQDFEPVHLDKPIDGTARLRERGVYLITGGLGGIGLTLAEHLAKTVQAKLILIGRSAFPAKEEWHDWLTTHDEHDGTSRKIKKVQALETQGAEVFVASADVADLSQMQEIITAAKQKFGSLNGVIHSAGVPDGALISRRTQEMTETVFAPKVTGTLVLDHLLQNVELDFFILCSSLASIFGIGGQIGYCAANAFLDAFAHFKKTKKDSLQPTVAINWDTWQDVGMAVDSAQNALSVFDRPQLPSNRELSHPLFDECIIEGVNQERYISHLNVSQHWVLDDHRIMGKAVLPGTAYLELAIAAFEPHAQSGIVEIRDIYFLHPLIVEDNEPKEVHTRLTKQGNSLEFEFVISSYLAPDTWQEHARGFIACVAAQPAKKHDIKAITSECDQQEIIIDPEFVQKPLAELSGFEAQLKRFGPHWYNLQRVKLGTHQGLAIIELPKDFVADLTDYQLHPALLDIATGFLKFHDPDKSHLPFSYKRLTIKAPLPAKIYSYVRYAHTQTTQTGMLQFNVTLMDEQGMELVDIEEYTLRKVEIDTATYQRYQAQHTAQREKVAPLLEKHQNFHLEIVTPGLLDTLTFRPIARHQPKPDEVEIEVSATGLNFKEVLYAVGLLQAPTDIQVKFGLECAGRIVTVGDNVKGFQINDEIIAFAPASFSAFTTTAATSIVPKPNNLNFEEAATIPVAFVTAYYALIKVGRLGKGERILIHAAAGGVGMAAVKIAQWMGAEIFATAGNTEKRAFLHSLGIQYVMDSRSLAFADEVMEYTKGKGVDVVLNSLGGEFIPKSLETLAPFGRFLELGIRDIHNNTQLGLRPFEKGLTYSFVSVGQETPHFQIIFQEVVQHFNEGHFSPIPHKVFPAMEVASAFDYMAQTKHIGKIVVSFQDKDTIITQDTRVQHSDQTRLHSRKPFVSEREKKETEDTTVTNLVQQNLKEGLLPIEGVDVFDRILGSRQSQILVSTRDIHSRLKQDSVATMLSSMKNAEPAPLSKPTHSRPQLGKAYVAPRNEIEQKIADIWQQFLGVEQVGIYDDFFDLGGNSLLAVQLIAKLREMLQIDLSVQSLLNTSTVAALAEFMGEKTPESKQLARQVLPSSLVEIQAGNSLKSPLFLVHPWGGHVYLYRDLAHLLGSEIPVYGIQAQGGDGKPLTKVEEMATHYIEAVRVRQPEGPYLIGGSSFGGMVAFEMAQQLQALDQKVALLTMMDTPGPSQMPIKFESDEEMLAYILHMGANISVSVDELRKLEPDEQLRYSLEKQKKMEKQLLPDMDITQARYLLQILKANAQAMWEYKPRVYQGQIIFFRAKEKDTYNAKAPERAWINLAQKGLKVIDVPGNHFTMHYPPHVQVMAERLIPYLA